MTENVTLSAADTSRSFYVSASAGEAYVLFVNVTRGVADVAFHDSSTGQEYLDVSFYPGDPRGTAGIGEGELQPPANVTWRVTVKSAFPDSALALSFSVAHVNSAPETHGAAINIGDTVNETMSDANDIDVFTLHGVAGAGLVVYVKLGSAPRNGILGAVVTDSLNQPLANGVPIFNPAVDIAVDRTRFPYTGTYRLHFAANGYSGGYRFWSGGFSYQPERLSATLPVDTEVRGESIDRGGDVDEFTFQVAAGAEYNAFIQAASSIELQIVGANSLISGLAISGSDTSLFGTETGLMRFTQAGPVVARVIGANTLDSDTGSYRLFLYPIDRRPEHASQSLVLGDTVNESIDHPGDIDEFLAPVVAGQLYNAFLLTASGSASNILQVSIQDADSAVLSGAQSLGSDTALLRQNTGNFAAQTSGTARVRVTGGPFSAIKSAGPYRFMMQHIDRKPELRADTIAPTDSLTGETIGMPGDIDEFRMHIPALTGGDLFLQSQGQGSVTAQFIDSATGMQSNLHTPAITAATQGAITATNSNALAPGTYIIRVTGDYGLNGPTRYALWSKASGLGPESTPDTIAVGDTIQGESILPEGDQDTYYYHGTQGQHVQFFLQGITAGIGLYTTAPNQAYLIVDQLLSPAGAASLTTGTTGRVDLPSTGWYPLTIGAAGTGAGNGRTQVGSYRFAVVPWPTAPEHVSSALNVGDSVTTEQLDYPGDVDRFAISGTPGSEVGLVFSTALACCNYPWVIATDPATGDTLGLDVGQNARYVGPLKIPTGGIVQVEVFERGFCNDHECHTITGPYRLTTLAINRAPEHASATIVLGDTVRTEDITIGDIDEFIGVGTPGDTLSLWTRLRANASPTGGFISGEIVDAATGSVLVGGPTSGLANSIPQFGGAVFVVPAGGQYIVRFFGTGDSGDDLTVAPYEFFVKKGP